MKEYVKSTSQLVTTNLKIKNLIQPSSMAPASLQDSKASNTDSSAELEKSHLILILKICFCHGFLYHINSLKTCFFLMYLWLTFIYLTSVVFILIYNFTLERNLCKCAKDSSAKSISITVFSQKVLDKFSITLILL